VLNCIKFNNSFNSIENHGHKFAALRQATKPCLLESMPDYMITVPLTSYPSVNPTA